MIAEDRLHHYTRPASESEDAQCQRATRMIQQAIHASAELKWRDYSIIPQGSYQNNTNARRNSDVDICVVMNDVFIPDYSDARGESSATYGFGDSSHVFIEDRKAIERALVAAFGQSGVTSGKKAFDVHSAVGSRVDADVVPAWRFRAFRGRDIYGAPISRDGITFWSTEGKQVINFPEQHYAIGNAKNTRTNTYYKKAVRILKHIRYVMLEEQVKSADGVSSFMLECMLYNLPDHLFTTHNTWLDTMQAILGHAYLALTNGTAHQDWVEVSGCKWLFRPTYRIPANWTAEQAGDFVRDAYQRIGY